MTLIATHPESVASTPWSAADEQFFRITAELFRPAFLLGATVLLASYDDEVAATTGSAPAPERSASHHAGHALPAAT